MSEDTEYVIDAWVHVNGEVYQPGDVPPPQVAAQIRNPECWKDGRVPPAAKATPGPAAPAAEARTTEVPAGEGATGEGATGEAPAGEGATGEAPAGEGATGEAPAGEGATGEGGAKAGTQKAGDGDEAATRGRARAR